MLWNIFCALVRPRTLEHHRQQGNLVWTNSNMQNSMAVFFSSVLDWKHPFWVSLAQKMKIVSFSWNLIHSLTQIWRTQRWCSLFLFFNDIPFYGKLVSKIKIFCWSWNLECRLIWLCKIQCWCSFILFWTFFASIVQKILLAFWWYLINLPAGY